MAGNWGANDAADCDCGACGLSRSVRLYACKANFAGPSAGSARYSTESSDIAGHGIDSKLDGATVRLRGFAARESATDASAGNKAERQFESGAPIRHRGYGLFIIQRTVRFPSGNSG
jgi:hypothetical protein